MIKSTILPGYHKAINGRDIIYTDHINLAAAKNGGDSAAVTLLSDENAAGVQICVGEPPAGVTCDMFLEHMLVANGEMWPDPLTEFSGELTLTAGEYQSVLLRFDCSDDAKAGDYSIPVIVKKGTERIAELTIELRIWNFTLGYEFTTAFGLNSDLFFRYHEFDKGDTEKEKALYKAYYDYMLERRVCAFAIPYDVLDPRADAYMSDPRVTSFHINGTLDKKDGDEMLIKRYEKVCTNPQWMKKAYIYPFDEPSDKETIDKMLDRTKELSAICPGLRQVSPFYADVKYDEEQDSIAILGDILEILCPKLACFDDDYVYRFNEEQRGMYPAFANRMAEYQKNGKDLWSYVCWEPGLPYTNVFVNEEGINHRICFWQTFLYGCAGFLYWCVNYWVNVTDPWADMATLRGWLTDKVHGDGSLLYNGSKVGVFGPCGSVRFEAVRAGIEDCELLTLAVKAFGREWVNAQIQKVTNSVIECNPSSELFAAVRAEIGNALEKKINLG